MNEDEQFVESLRPDSVFGSLGAADDFDVETEFDVPYGQDNETAPTPTMQPGPVTSAPSFPAQQSGGSTGAAITLFTVAGGAALGWHFGKAKGAAGGALAGGALRNLYRTQQAVRGSDAIAKSGAVKQGIIGLLGLGLGGYLMWTANKK